MKTLSVAICVTAVTLLLTGCDSAPPDTREADSKAIKDLETQWNHDFAQRDSTKLAAYYTPDAAVMTTGMPAASSPASISQMIKGLVADPAFALKFHSTKVEVAKSGDMAYSQGAYTMTFTAPNKKVTDDHGNFVTVYKKQADGTWKVVSDIVTSDVPPAVTPVKETKKKAAPARKGKRR